MARRSRNTWTAPDLPTPRNEVRMLAKLLTLKMQSLPLGERVDAAEEIARRFELLHHEQRQAAIARGEDPDNPPTTEPAA